MDGFVCMTYLWKTPTWHQEPLREAGLEGSFGQRWVLPLILHQSDTETPPLSKKLSLRIRVPINILVNGHVLDKNTREY